VINEIKAMVDNALVALSEARNTDEVEQVRWSFLGRAGRITNVLKQIGSLPQAERKPVGASANAARDRIQAAAEARIRELQEGRFARLAELEAIDVTFPAPPLDRGHIHVLNQVRSEVETILERLGYQVEEGPEIETDWYCFEALNLPKGHASRDLQETFFLAEDESIVLRTHTSSVQIRAMERLRTPPIFVIAPGRVYRRDNLDATHLPYFMQVEGLAVDEDLTVGDLKGTLLYLVQSLFGPERRVRMRPTYFPYTEPSFEFDTLCGRCDGAGCRSCGNQGWLETGGCGMVHPNVLRNGGVDPEKYTGFAWGFGIERMALLKYDVEDLRLFYENDLRFNEQF